MGLLAQQVWARDPDDIGKRARRKQLPISQKESQKWLHSLDAVYTARDCCPTTHIISVGDREADVYDVLAAPRPVGVDLLIRASWNRCVTIRRNGMCGTRSPCSPWRPSSSYTSRVVVHNPPGKRRWHCAFVP